MDRLLDDDVFFGPFEPFLDPRCGRPSTPRETHLRLIMLVVACQCESGPGMYSPAHTLIVIHQAAVPAQREGPLTPPRLTQRFTAHSSRATKSRSRKTRPRR